MSYLHRPPDTLGDKPISDGDLVRIPSAALWVYRVLQHCCDEDGICHASLTRIVDLLGHSDIMVPRHVAAVPALHSRRKVWRLPLQFRRVKAALQVLDRLGLAKRCVDKARLRGKKGWRRSSTRRISGILWTDLIPRVDWRVPVDTLLAIRELPLRAGSGGPRLGTGPKTKIGARLNRSPTENRQNEGARLNRNTTFDYLGLERGGLVSLTGLFKAAPSYSNVPLSEFKRAHIGKKKIGKSPFPSSKEEVTEGHPKKGAFDFSLFPEGKSNLAGMGGQESSPPIPPPKREEGGDLPIGHGWLERKRQRREARMAERRAKEEQMRNAPPPVIVIPGEGEKSFRLAVSNPPTDREAILDCLGWFSENGYGRPSIDDLGLPRRPRPPKLPANLGDSEILEFVVKAHRGAVAAVFNKSSAAKVFWQGLPRRRDPQFRTIVEAAKLLREEEISPISWAHWKLSTFVAFKRKTEGKKPRNMPFVTTVFAPGPIERHLGWFNAEIADGIGGEVLFVPSARELIERHSAMVRALQIGQIGRSPDRDAARQLAETFFPRGLLQQLIGKSRQESQEVRSALIKSVRAGEWIW